MATSDDDYEGPHGPGCSCPPEGPPTREPLLQSLAMAFTVPVDQQPTFIKTMEDNLMFHDFTDEEDPTLLFFSFLENQVIVGDGQMCPDENCCEWDHSHSPSCRNIIRTMLS